MGRNRFPVISLILFISLKTLTLYALTPDSDVIVLTLWTEVSKTVPSISGDSSPDDLEGLSEKVLSDAKWIISGMIYGYQVKYVPYDKDRKVAEYFKADPVYSIPFGDPALRITSSRFEKGRFFVEVRYDLADFQLRRLNLWNSNIYPEAEGIGRASFFKGDEARIEAVKEGMKEALRGYLRARIKNKPREILGKVLIDQPPYIIIDAGGYSSKTRIKLDIEKIIPYSVY